MYSWAVIIAVVVFFNFILGSVSEIAFCLQCFEAVGWAAGRASGL